MKRFEVEESYLIKQVQGLDRDKAAALSRRQGRYATYGVPIVGPVRAELKLCRYYTNLFSLTLVLADGDGYMIDLASRQYDIAEPADTNNLLRYDEWKTRRLALSGASKTLVETLRKDSLARLDNKLFGDPASIDPLSFVAQDGILQVAEALGLDVVACLPDSAAGAASQLDNPEQAHLDDFVQAVAPELKWNVNGKVLVISPALPSINRTNRLNRAVFSRFMATVRQRGFPVLDDAAQYVVAQRDGAYQLEWLLFRLNGSGEYACPPLTGVSGTTMGYREGFKLYALLSRAQREVLASGGTLTARDLSPAARAQLSFRLYNRDLRLHVKHENLDNGRTFPTLDGPTDLLPQGLPLDTTLSLTSRVETGGYEDLDGSVGRFWDCSAIGYVQWQQDHGEFLDPRMGYPPMSTTKFRPGTSTSFTIKLTYVDGVDDEIYLRDMSVDPRFQPVTWRSLPTEYRDAAQKTYDVYQKMPAPSIRRNPPPPR